MKTIDLEALKTGCWAVAPEYFESAIQQLMKELEAEQVDIKAFQSSFEPQVVGSVAVIPVHGTIHQSMTLQLTRSIKKAGADESISAILLDIDSPGGTVTGTPELASSILEVRKQKRITAHTSGLMASAAYWIAASADEIVATPSANIGSVGVFAAHVDLSKMLERMGVKFTFIASSKEKVEGNPYEPLSKETKEFFQSRIDEHMKNFVGAIAKGRNIAKSQVKSNFGNGRTFLARESLDRGMIDRVASLDDTLSKMLRSSKHRDGARTRIETVRDLEQYLRDGGISVAKAKTCASLCAEELQSEQPETVESTIELNALKDGMAKLRGKT